MKNEMLPQLKRNCPGPSSLRHTTLVNTDEISINKDEISSTSFKLHINTRSHKLVNKIKKSNKKIESYISSCDDIIKNCILNHKTLHNIYQMQQKNVKDLDLDSDSKLEL